MRADDTTHDEEITEALTYADSRIDSQFTEIDQTVPSPTPELIQQASEDLAAYFYYRHRKAGIEKATIFLVDGEKALLEYINANYFKGGITTVRPPSTGTEV